MQITAIQLDSVWEDPAGSVERVRNLLESNILASGGLVVLPEMFATGYSMAVDQIAESTAPASDASPATDCLEFIARQYGVTVIGGLVAADASGKGRNDALAVGPTGQHLARYTKMHPMTLGGESQHYLRGDKVVSFDWPLENHPLENRKPNAVAKNARESGVDESEWEGAVTESESGVAGGLKVAPFICYDLRFAEVFRIASLEHRAEVLVVIANFPTVRHEHWKPLLIARAIENQAYVVGVNRCGADPNLQYSGGSIIIDPLGQVVAEAGADECVIQADIDPKAPDRFRQKLPALKDAWVKR